MATLRSKLANGGAPRSASEKDKDEEMKGKGKSGETAATDDEEGEGENETPPNKKPAKEAAAKPAGTKAISPERARMKAITGSEAAGHLPKLAAHLAYDTDLSADEANAVMAAALEDVDTEASETTAPRQAAETSPKGAAFRKAMDAEAPNPKLGAAGGKAEPEDEWLAAAKGMGVA